MPPGQTQKSVVVHLVNEEVAQIVADLEGKGYRVNMKSAEAAFILSFLVLSLLPSLYPPGFFPCGCASTIEPFFEPIQVGHLLVSE